MAFSTRCWKSLRSTVTTLMPFFLNSSTSSPSRLRMSLVAFSAASCDDVGEQLLFGRRQLGHEAGRDHREQRVGDVAGQDDVLLHLVELLGLDGGQRVFLRVHGAVLQRQVDLGEGDRRRVGAAGARQRGVGRRVGHAHLQALHLVAVREQLVAGRVARAVVGEGGDGVAGGLLVALGQLLEHVALAVLDHVVGVAEREGVVADGQARDSELDGERGAGEDDVHRAQLQALVDVAFLAQAGGGEHLDLVLAVGALLEFLAGPDRPLVVRLGGLVHVGPFQLGLGLGHAEGLAMAPAAAAGGDQFEGEAFFHDVSWG